MNEILITCWIILMMWCILFIGNIPSLKVNKKPELDNYIAMVYLRIYYGYEETSFDSNWDEWEENRVIWVTCYTEQQPSTIQQASMEGKWIAYQDVKVTCAGGTHDILCLDFDEDNGV